jgi:hypothetical protein
VARRYAVNANLIHKWLRDLRFSRKTERTADLPAVDGFWKRDEATTLMIDLHQKQCLGLSYNEISGSGAEPAEERIANILGWPHSTQAGKVKKLSERELSAKWTP